MSIGEALAEARRQAGLSVTQVSQQTCIRETLIRGIERDDFSACGGDFYVRGHIRSIARAVGADPAPLLGEYDGTHPQAITAADVFQPVRPIKIRERHRLNWAAALALAVVAALGFVAYHFISQSRPSLAASGALHQASHRLASHRPASHGPASHRPASRATPAPSPTATRRPNPYAGKITIRLNAVQDCWVGFTTPSQRQLFQSYVVAGTSKQWSFRRAVDMRLGNPGGVKLTVDGRNPLPPGTVQPITLRLRLGGRVST